jgi:small subunit ribosomal protein S21|tara:strand:+ start:417 stop:665 length:249 start_codon:yes stop_codon:yes gene_type:complete
MAPREYNRPPRDPSPQGTKVDVRDNNVGQAMRRLKKLLQVEGVFKEMRDRRFFEKPSMKRKKAQAAAKKRWQKELAKRDDGL